MERNGKSDADPESAPRPEVAEGGRNPMRGLLLWLLLVAAILMTFKLYFESADPARRIGYSGFRELVIQKQIEKCEIVIDRASGRSIVRGQVKSAEESALPQTDETLSFQVEVLPGDRLEALLDEHGIEYSYVYQNPILLQLLTGAIPILLILGVLYFIFMRQMRSAGHGAMSFGKSRARLLSLDTHKVTFENVAGIDEAKEEVQEIIEYLRDPKRFQKLGGRIPKGVLLMGPPGTGKTLLAKAIAGEAGVAFFSISGSDFVEMFVGVGASRVRDMFEQGKKSAPCIIFIDEIDAVGRSRFTGIGGGHDEREQTLNALLVEMDGFNTQEGVIIIAATNRPDVLDNALLRPGRFDRQIVIDLPTIDGREAILKMHARKVKLARDADLRRVARGTPGFSGADLANLLNEAALLAAKEGRDAIGMASLEEARDKVRWGRERRGYVLDEKEKHVTAVHEAGHAVVMLLLENSEPLHKVTIIPRGTAYLGATMQLPEKDRHMETQTKLESMLVGLMGGRAAEEIVFGDVTSGAAGDLKEATRIARLMMCSWGMSGELGPQAYGANDDHIFLGREMTRTRDFSEDTARRIDAEVNRVLSMSLGRARELLTGARDRLDMVTRLLLEHETLDGRDVADIVKHGRILGDEERGGEESTGARWAESSAADAGDARPSRGPRGGGALLPPELPAPGAACEPLRDHVR